MHAHSGTGIERGPLHDEGHREERDDGTGRRKRYRKGNIALGKHGKDVARRTARTTGYEHDTDEKHRRQRECNSDTPGDERKDHQLSEETRKHGFRTTEDEHEIDRTQRQSELEHQEGEYGQYDKNAIHQTQQKLFPGHRKDASGEVKVLKCFTCSRPDVQS